MHRYTDEQKTQIIEEYRAAVAAGAGGGAAVAKKYELAAAQIIQWGKRREGKATKSRRPPDRAGAPIQRYDAAIEAMIAYHKTQLGHLEALREGYAA